MKVITLAAVAAVALFAGLAAGAAYYSFVLGETEARHQSLVKELRDENARLQNLLTQTNNQLSRLQSDYRSLQTQLENAETRGPPAERKACIVGAACGQPLLPAVFDEHRAQQAPHQSRPSQKHHDAA
ncbi:MAG: hypothetical protein RMH74_04000 [Candidatus Caldarchaeum sp.]|nr:hypothetical protein [Candidatus Caldarchaeum sp.]